MAKSFEMTAAMRRGKSIITRLLRLGLPMGPIALLAVRGRKTGAEYTAPVAVMTYGQDRWLVGAFGEVSWVRNLRASGEASLLRGQHREHIRVAELPAAEAAPVLKEYLKRFGIVPFMRPYFEVKAAAPLADFEREAQGHPVFRVIAG